MKRWLLAWGPALVWAGVVFALSSVPGKSLPQVQAPDFDKVAHLGVYAVLGALVLRGLLRTTSLTSRRAIVLAMVLGTLYGITDEFHQSFTPGRTPDWHDVAADAAGSLLGALAAAKLMTLAAALKRRRRDPP
jgi:VanZ family protein